MRERIAAARSTHQCPVATEKRLMAAAGKNPYEKALLLMQMAQLRTVNAEQVCNGPCFPLCGLTQSRCFPGSSWL